MVILAAALSRWAMRIGQSVLLVATAACAPPAPVAVPPVPAGQARIWFYREFIPSESLNVTAVSMNDSVVGYSRLGDAFYRDVAPGQYHVTVATWGVDTNQAANVALAAGQEAFIRIESLRSWSSVGDRASVERDTFYARLVPAQIARGEVARSTFDSGN